MLPQQTALGAESPPEPCPAASHSALWASVSRVCRARDGAGTLRQGPVVGWRLPALRFSPDLKFLPLRLAKRRRMLSCSSSPLPTEPPLRTFLDSWPASQARPLVL